MTLEGLAQRFTHAFTKTDLILYAGTNLPCPIPAAPDTAPLAMMPVIDSGHIKQQPNVAAISDIESIAAGLLCGIFQGGFAEARFQSCTQANLAIFTALLKPGDTLICLHSGDGGHPSQNADGMLDFLPVKVLSMPFDHERQCVDDAATARLVRLSRPRIVVLGPSVIIRPSVIARTAAATAAMGAALVVDVSHVAGLIAGGLFPNPLEHGADLITASSYKTLGCPPTGFVIGRNRRFERRIREAVSPRLVSNYDADRLFRFTAALAHVRGSLHLYARAILANTGALRAALIDQNLRLLTPADGTFGTHQIVVTTRSKTEAARIVADLQDTGVTTSLCKVPGRPRSWGIRLGTQLITRRGMGADQMIRIARIIATVVRAKRRPNLRVEVQRLTRDFRSLMYCGNQAQNTARERLSNVH